MSEQPEDPERTKRLQFVKDREDTWLIARNLANNAGCDFDMSDILNVALFISGDLLNSVRISTEAEDEDEEAVDDESSS